MLKANYDSGADHIDMLLPFVLDCINARQADDLTAEEARRALAQRHDVFAPLPAVQIVMNRATKRGYVRREGGKYLKCAARLGGYPDLAARRLAVVADQTVLGSALRDFAERDGTVLQDDQEAVALLLQFINHFHVDMLLFPLGGSPRFVADSDSAHLSEKYVRLVSRFILERCLLDNALSALLQHALEGFVLQNALFLKDLSKAASQFSDLTVYLDTNFLLDALGLAGPSAEAAALEGLAALRAAGATRAVFDRTLDEIRAILGQYESRLGTSAGIRSLRPTPVSRHVLTTLRWQPSDASQWAALLPRKIQALGVQIREVPEYRRESTLDEKQLISLLRAPGQGPEEADYDNRIAHDVRCIGAVLTLRACHTTDTYDNCRAVLATKTGLLVKHAREWYSAQGQHGVPPVVHVLSLTSIAWLKRPVACPHLTLQEMVALCSAALTPSQRTWSLFLGHLGKLCESGEMDCAEAVSIVANRITDAQLARFEDSVDPDSVTVAEVVERVRAAERAEMTAEIARVQSDADAKLVELSTRKEQEQAAERVRRDNELDQERLRRAAAEDVAKWHERALSESRSRARSFAAGASWALIVMLALVLIAGPPACASSGLLRGTVLRVVTFLVSWATVVFGVANMIWGHCLSGLRASLANWLYLRTLAMMRLRAN
jgi:hypothetical protein